MKFSNEDLIRVFEYGEHDFLLLTLKYQSYFLRLKGVKQFTKYRHSHFTKKPSF